MINLSQREDNPLIPKVIHYCWFGGSPLGSDERACIESWKKFFPDYEIVRWDESNFDVNCCPYVSQAYSVGKWAFVSDYARFAILYEHGGLYFDTDVEVIRPMDDIIAKGPFMGLETDARGSGNNKSAGTNLGLSVAPGLGLSANPGLGLYKFILDSYLEDEFCRSDGTLNPTTVVVRTTNILRSCGLKEVPGIQEVAGVTIYPSEFFNPKDFYTGEIRTTENTRSIHHFGMSWLSDKEKFSHRLFSWGLKHGLTMRSASYLSRVGTILRYADVGHAYHALRRRLSGGSE